MSWERHTLTGNENTLEPEEIECPRCLGCRCDLCDHTGTILPDPEENEE